MSIKKSRKGWKKFSFEDSPKESPKHQSKPENDEVIIPKEFNFEAKIAPKELEDLAVHNKKITEVKTWLELNVLCSDVKKNGTFLLITGPTGCGKTVTVKVLCKVMEIEILEWINPIDRDYELFRDSGQTAKLLEFLSESKYPSLLTLNKSKVIIIEDFPNSVINSPEEFLKVLQQCSHSKLAVIFICTDATNNNINLSQKLFPQEVRDVYNINNISFNACSATLLKQNLKRVQKIIEHNTDFKAPNEDIIDGVIASSMGDIRCAVNQYYFACLKGGDFGLEMTEVPKPGNKRKRNERKTVQIKMMMKDENLGFFHSLGRVLNPKRIEKGDSWRLQANIDTLIDELSIQPTTFSSFLYENYLKYFGNLRDVSRASELLSTSYMVLGKWSENSEHLLYGLWISVLAVMVNNEHRVTKWTQITAPKKIIKVTKMQIDDLNIEDRSYFNIITRTNHYKTFY